MNLGGSPLNQVFRKFSAIFAVSILSAGMALAQITSGDIAGTVKDATGAAIPNATVVITNEATGVTTTLTANSAGEFHASNLPAGSYDVAVSNAGFQAYKLKGLEVETNRTATKDIVLSVGTTQSVEVTADAGVVLDTTTTNLTTTFSTEELANLPTATVGLGVLNTSLLSPGVASTGGIGIGIGPSIGGQRPRNNNFTIEGIDNNNKAVTGPLVYVAQRCRRQLHPHHQPVLARVRSLLRRPVQHHRHLRHQQIPRHSLRVLPEPQPERRERNRGRQGSRNPRYDNNRYGGQVGGPIFKDKLFFFANYERKTIGQSHRATISAPRPLPGSPPSTASPAIWLQRHQPSAVHQIRARRQLRWWRTGDRRERQRLRQLHRTAGHDRHHQSACSNGICLHQHPARQLLITAPHVLQLRRPDHQHGLEHQRQGQHPRSLYLQHPGRRGHRRARCRSSLQPSPSSIISSLCRSTTPSLRT